MKFTLSITLIEGRLRHVLTFSEEPRLLRKDMFESIGFQFENIKNELCHKVILPDGWQFNSISERDTYFHIIDKKKQNRATLMILPDYINLYVLTRYCLLDKYIDNEKTAIGVFAIDSINGTELYYAGSYKNGGLHMFERLTRKAHEYLNNHYPDWQNPTMYWN